MDERDPATGWRFDVTVDGEDIGSFTACEGLGAEYDVMEYHEGGENSFTHRFPGSLRYANIRLTRPVDVGSASLAKWFSGLRDSVQRRTASIKAIDPTATEIARWDLVDVYPAKWTGPTFSVDGNVVVTETLELAHNGFLG
jgi:phage tail-like protein